MKTLQLDTAAASLTGPKPRNEDAWCIAEPPAPSQLAKGWLVAVADGVSQCLDGQLAARSTLHALVSDYYACPQQWALDSALEQMLQGQHNWLRTRHGSEPLLTTLTAMILRQHRFHAVHLGDCRLYRWRRGEWACLTREHVCDRPGMEHVLTRALGLGEQLQVDHVAGELQVEDLFLLLSDGVWAVLGATSLLPSPPEREDLQAWVNRLGDQAIAQGGRDNATALAVRVRQLPEAASCEALSEPAPLLPPARLKPGDRLDGLTVTGLLQRSRQNLLYGVTTAEGHPAVLKTLSARQAEDPQLRQALWLEEWMLKRLEGNGCPEVLDLPDRSALYFVQRRIPGESLAQRVAAQRLSLPQAIRIAVKLASLLIQLEQHRVLHRDIKPDNLMLDPEGELSFIDFGLATIPGLNWEPASRLPGTPSYLAPELYRGAPYGTQTELYAAGVTLYFALTGHYPYGEIEPFQHPEFGQPTPPTRWRPDTPAWFEEALMRAVARDPAERFTSARQWLDTLIDAGTARQPDPLPPSLPLEKQLQSWQWIGLLSLLANLLLLFALLR